MEAGTDFIFLGSKISADDDLSREIRRCFLLGKKAMTNLDRVLKSKDIIPTKIRIVKALVFPVVVYRSKDTRLLSATEYIFSLESLHLMGNLSFTNLSSWTKKSFLFNQESFVNQIYLKCTLSSINQTVS